LDEIGVLELIDEDVLNVGNALRVLAEQKVRSEKKVVKVLRIRGYVSRQ